MSQSPQGKTDISYAAFKWRTRLAEGMRGVPLESVLQTRRPASLQVREGQDEAGRQAAPLSLTGCWWWPRLDYMIKEIYPLVRA